MMRRRAWFLLAALAVVVAVATALIPWGETPSSPAAVSFLDAYVDPDGRVVRRDEGGDTVSEGQAYALLLAAAIGDEATFDRVWRWTTENLRRPDGLLAWRWDGGRIVDWEFAPDADLDVIRALLLGAERFASPRLKSEALDMAAALHRSATVQVDGSTFVVAGSWARSAPYTVNPSYAAVRTFELLADETGDEVWDELVETSLAVVAESSDPGTGLPPDWVSLSESGAVEAIGPPSDPAGGPRYGLDAVRVPFRLGEACDPEARRLAARPWGFLQSVDDLVAVYDLAGIRKVGWSHPAALVGAAAAAGASGDLAARDRLLELAREADETASTYYGSAWVAMAEVATAGELAPPCP